MLSQAIKTKNQLVYENLKDEIVHGEIPPGTRIRIQSTARLYGVSESPVREALKKLEAEGLVNNKPHAGFMVTEPDFRDREKVFETRQLLEGHATWLAALNIDDASLERLKDIIERMKSCDPLDASTLTALNDSFHNLIYASCGNPILYQLTQEVAAMEPRTKSIFFLARNRIRSSIEEHEEIYKQLAAGNADKARQSLCEHKQRSYDLLLSKY